MDPDLKQEISAAISEIALLIPAEHSTEAASKFDGLLRVIEAVDRTATTDVLTGLPNLRSLIERDSRDTSIKTNESRPNLNERRQVEVPEILGWWTEYIDLDRFKEINDKYGHEQGDRILRYMSLVMKQSLRKHDEIYRIGGDEFIIFGPMFTPKRSSYSLKDKLNQRLP